MTLDTIDNRLREIYAQCGFIDSQGGFQALHLTCSHATECWKRAAKRKPEPTPDKSAISRPWVGPSYDKLRLLVLGINMNECAGYDALSRLMGFAQPGIQSGGKRSFGDPKRDFAGGTKRYPGTLLYHRMACYAAAFVSAGNLMNLDWESGGIPPGPQLAEALNYISFTNHIKCSPTGQLSEPPWEMWENCGRHVLRQEIQILQPAHILVFGRSANTYALGQFVFEGNVEWGPEFGATTRTRVRIGHYSDEHLDTKIYALAHPHARGVSFMKVLNNLREAISATRAGGMK